MRRLDDGVLGIEAGEAGEVRDAEAGQRQRADQHQRPGVRQLGPQAAHFAHVLLVMHGVDHRAGAEEQQRLEEGVREQVEDAGLIGADAAGDEHVAELRAGRIGDDALDVVLHEADGGGEEGGDGADEHHELQRVRRLLEDRRQARHHEHAGGDHGRGVDQRRDGRRALHGVGEPGVQQELRRLAHGAHEQQQAQRRQDVDLVAEELEALAGHAGRGVEQLVEVDGVEHREQPEDAEREAEVADAVDDEGLDGRRVGLGLGVPEADQQVGEEADALPAEEHLHEVVGRHQHQHGEGEAAEVGEEARAAVVLLHVADGVDVHERGDRRHDDEHHRRQRVDLERPADVEFARRDPALDGDVRRLVAEADAIEDDPRQHAGDEQQAGGDQLRGTRPEQAAEQAGDEPAERRQEDDGRVDHDDSAFPSPSAGDNGSPKLRR